jgi:2',3'-cyclic-nucleotide 2'-phosphodiesterase (5'-nucleotidase family)
MRELIRFLLPIAALAVGLGACAPSAQMRGADTVTISVVGSNDVHGELVPRDGRGGLTTLSGYVAALRDARADDGAVLLVDAGDMWQGTLESNLAEGADVVAVYNALGYVAATIGNHEFDFGPAGPKFVPTEAGDDPQGALKKRAAELQFPLLAANLIDTRNGQAVAWPNVRPSVSVELDGVRIGIVGVVTAEALQTTMAANTVGLAIAPLAPAIIREATSLRAAGADIVVVLAHAGGKCEAFEDPHDLSSCDMTDEIMQLAYDIPAGLVDHIVAGHKHRGIAHIVNGIAITASYSNTRAFSRVDFTVDRASHHVVSRKVFPPQVLCGKALDAAGQCVEAGEAGSRAVTYENRPVTPMPAVVALAEAAEARAAVRKSESLGVYLETPITLNGHGESALGNLFTDAVLESNDADVSIHNVHGGIRNNLPQGELTFGSVYEMFPFDNRLTVVEISGADLRKIIAAQVHNVSRRAGFSGMHVFVGCDGGRMAIRMVRADGHEFSDGDSVRLVANDFLALGGDDILTPAIPPQGFPIPDDSPLVRDTLVDWFREHGGSLRADDFLDPRHPRWILPDPVPEVCEYSAP